MDLKNSKSKKMLFVIFLLLVTFSSIYLTFSYYTNTVKFFTDSRQPSGYSSYSLERDSLEFLEDGCGTNTMLDTVTGLCWTKDMNYGTYRWATNTGYDEPKWDGNSNYIWPEGTSDVNYPAFNVCDDLTLGGHTDWRLPRKMELLSLSDEIGGSGSTCATLTSFGFTDCVNSDYWTSTELKYSLTNAWHVDLNSALDSALSKTTFEYVLCVRDNFNWSNIDSTSCSTDVDGDGFIDNSCASYPMYKTNYEGDFDISDSNSTVVPDMNCFLKTDKSSCAGNYVVNGCGTGTVLDTTTGLCWLRDFTTTINTWSNGQSYCNGLSFAGHTDWYMPSRQEFISILDRSRTDLAVIGGNNSIFTNVQNFWYWTASTYRDNPSSAWGINLGDGRDGSAGKTGATYLVCVRRV